jgi:hypothetical protein
MLIVPQPGIGITVMNTIKSLNRKHRTSIRYIIDEQRDAVTSLVYSEADATD